MTVRTRLLITFTATALVLTACTTTDPKSGNITASNTTKGAGIGALAGAAIGALTSNKSGRAKGVFTGAAAGGAIGAGGGYLMDRQEQKLRERMKDTGVELQRNGDSLNVVLPGDISFDTGSAQVKESFRSSLDGVAESLVENPASQINVFGHTDSTGNYSSNLELSQSRAQAVSNYLQSRGVEPRRLVVVAIGPDNPIGDNKTVDGRAKNRRVEIKIVPHAQNG